MDLLWVLAAIPAFLGTWMQLPQLVHLWRRKNAAGVSLVGFVANLITYLAWFPYRAVNIGLDVALAFMSPFLIQVVLLVLAVKYRGEKGSPVVPALMSGSLITAGALGGWTGLGVALSFTVVWAYAPALWSVCRARSVSGISVFTWVLCGGYGLPLVPLGVLSGDVPTLLQGIGNLIFPALIIIVVLVRRRRERAAQSAALSAQSLPAQRSPDEVAGALVQVPRAVEDELRDPAAAR